LAASQKAAELAIPGHQVAGLTVAANNVGQLILELFAGKFVAENFILAIHQLPDKIRGFIGVANEIYMPLGSGQGDIKQAPFFGMRKGFRFRQQQIQ
jgi:hypothetical protein